MNYCNICGSEDLVEDVGGEYLCLECSSEIEEAIGELNEFEDNINLDDEFWAQVLEDELEEWKP